MDDERNILFVNSHPERARRRNDPHISPDKRRLGSLAFSRRQSRMIAGRSAATLFQQAEHFFRVLMGGTIYNPAFTLLLFQRIQQRPVFIGRGLLCKKQVGPVKASGDHGRAIQSQAFDHILPHPGRSRCRKGRIQRPLRQRLHKTGDFQVSGTEIVSPLGNAMGFVHHYKVRRILSGKTDKELVLQPFRGKIQQFVNAPAHIIQHFVIGMLAHAAVDTDRRDSLLPQVFHLVFHQGDEG